jgi:hypothetical protein
LNHNWDESLEKLCSSDEEIKDLKELASLLSGMEPVQPSPSFQSELKSKLLAEKAGTKARIFPWGGKFWIRPSFAAVAALILVVSLSVFYSAEHPVKREPLTAAQKELVSNQAELTKPDTGEVPDGQGGEEQETGEEEVSWEQVPETEKRGQNELPAVDDDKSVTSGSHEQAPLPSQGGLEEGEQLRKEPQFEIWEKQQVLQLAGGVKLPDYYYHAGAGDADLELAEAKHTWRPGGKYVIVLNNGDQHSMESKVTKTLSTKGFQVEGAYLEINDIQETQKGVFAEVFFKPQKSSPDDPVLVVYYEEGKDITAYYYEEKGKTAKPGFYPLLSPSQAFERSKEANIYAASQPLRFSFQEVELTCYDFLLEGSGQQKTVKLPAYCFTGMETTSNGQEFKLYLPAVAQ